MPLKKAYLIAKKYMDQAEELNQAKDNAQTALALKKLFQEQKPKVNGPSIVELTKFYKILQNRPTLNKGRGITITPDYCAGRCSASK